MRLFLLVCFSLLSAYAYANKLPANLLRELSQANSDSARLNIYARLAEYHSSSDYDSSLFYAGKGIELARAIKDRPSQYGLLNKVANVHHEHGDLILSKKYAEDALRGFERINDSRGIAACYLTLGTIAGKGGRFPEATASVLKGLKIYEKIHHSKGVFDSYIKLGLINEKSDNLDQALVYYNKAQALITKDFSKKSSVALRNNVGVVHAKKGNMKEALKYFMIGLQEADSTEHADLYISSLTNAGNAYQHLGYRDSAYAFHKKSLEKARSLRLPEKESRALINIAALYVEKKDYEKAIKLLDQSFSIANNIGHSLLVSELYEGYIEIFQAQGRYKDAFTASQKLRTLTDSLFSKDKKRAAEVMQAEYYQEKSEAQIKTLETLSGKTTFQRNVGIAIAVLVIVLLLVVFFSLRNVQKFNRRLKVSNHIKDKLFSIIGHDLRGPMGSVVQMLTLMEDDLLKPGELKEVAHILKKHTEASLSTLDSLLEWGRTQIQGVSVKEQIVEVATAVDIARDFFFAACTVKNIRIDSNIPPDLKISADIDHFNFLLRNLLSNAIKFSYPNSAIEISATHRDGFVCFSVRDYGKGMEELDAAQLFETFSLKAEGTNGEQGTGIGLMLCKEFVSANGGRIWVNAGSGKGAEFCFTLKGI
ncbi:tetratricopeptide repeat protein [Arcticibacter pallidicorallinus]|uniref:histidine kinase n=1 Tax=Arcticibacter pallidicorallinus TaxID=1259464 RepID=A0A2T0TV10_9SPHI|nr:tetratricopeptide repeat protein [Arcticibacter pallidicorallinus]PRY49497.1 tetratricopeptide repeat protein [Arcticibacter pallidicorallinus]